MSTQGVKGGPAFEIRFCKGNKVQVFDLSKRRHVGGNQPLPNEYLEDDVINGRLRYSKLGNQWISYNSMNTTNQQYQQRLVTTPTEACESNPKVVPALAKQREIEDAKELEHIRQAQEAMQKAMDRKKKIEMARRARKDDKENVMEDAASNLYLEILAGNKDDDDLCVTENRNEETPSNQMKQEQVLPPHTETKNRSIRVNKKSSFLHENGPPPATPLPKRQPNNYNTISHNTNDFAANKNGTEFAERSLKHQSFSSLSKMERLPIIKNTPERLQEQNQSSSYHQDNRSVNPKSPSSVWCCIIS